MATILIILKSMIGGTLIVLPGAFRSAGLLAGSALLIGLGTAEIFCMVLLIECSKSIGGGSYGDIAYQAVGARGALIVDASLFLSQLGFVCAEMLYVAKNGHASLVAMGWETAPSVTQILLGQLLLLVPMAWIRRLEYFTITNLLANVVVLSALATLTVVAVQGLVENGPAADVVAVGPGWPLFAGTAVFAFECINFVIPMYEAHNNKETFVPILTGTLGSLIGFFIFFAGINYVCYGHDTKPVLTMNLRQDSLLGKLMPMMFAFASLFTAPLLLFPASIVAEGYILSSVPSWSDNDRKNSRVRTWKKNGIRTGLAVICAFLSAFGAQQVEAFISLIGAFACVPLALVYPCIFHARLCGTSRFMLIVNILISALGVGIFFFTSSTALTSFLSA